MPLVRCGIQSVGRGYRCVGPFVSENGWVNMMAENNLDIHYISFPRVTAAGTRKGEGWFVCGDSKNGVGIGQAVCAPSVLDPFDWLEAS